MTRNTRLQALRALLRRRKAYKFDPDAPRTRVSTPHWRRTHEIVHPERDLSEWVGRQLVTDWDNVKRGRNKY
jgi:hypothetical protein